MSFENSVDASIRPNITVRAEPAHAVISRAQGSDSQVADAKIGREVPGNGDSPTLTPEEDFSFYDLIDVINPLQHIPVVSSLYREITGDEIKAPARVLGGFLFGGPVGFVASAVNAIAVEATGRDLGEAAVATLFGDDEPPVSADLAEAVPAEGLTGASSDALLDESAAAAIVAAEPAAGAPPPALPDGIPVPPPAPAPAPALAAAAVLPRPGPASGAAQGTSATELLLGQDALDALAADLAGHRKPSAPMNEPAPAAAPRPEPSGAIDSAEASAAAVAHAAASTATSAVPANLVDVGSRDRRGLGPVLPAQLPPRSGPSLPGEKLLTDEARRLASTDTGSRIMAPKLPGQAAIDPTLLPPPPLPDTGVSAGGSAADQVLAGDISAQMIDALKKYEALMQKPQWADVPRRRGSLS